MEGTWRKPYKAKASKKDECVRNSEQWDLFSHPELSLRMDNISAFQWNNNFLYYSNFIL